MISLTKGNISWRLEKCPFFSKANLDNHTTDISRRENGAHVRIRIRPAWQARGINGDESAMETLSWCRLQIIIIMMIMAMIMILVINYNKDRGLGFSYICMIPDPQLPSNLFECRPPGHDLCNCVNKYVLLLEDIDLSIANENKTSRRAKECSNFLLSCQRFFLLDSSESSFAVVLPAWCL